MTNTGHYAHSEKWKWFWSIRPIGMGRYEKFEKLPFLERNDSMQITVGFVCGGIASLLALIIGVESGSLGSTLPDPWTKAFLLRKGHFFVTAWILLFILTGLICWKQWGHYYDVDGGGKQGIFVTSIRWVNYLDRTMDYLLAITGSFMFVMAVLPIWWFLTFFVYSILIILRCLFTLLRGEFANMLKRRREDVKSWYTESLTLTHNKLEVRAVLVGWILTMLTTAIYSLVAFLFFLYSYPWYPDPSGMFLLYFLVLVGEIAIFIGIRHFTYPFGKKICDRLNIGARISSTTV